MPRESERPTQNGKQAVTDRPLKAGTLLGDRYRIDRVLGFGGMGVVYRARDLRLDIDIALKRIRPDRMSPERRETLRREIILSRRVTHPNVCRVYDLVEIDGEDFVSMEFLSGRTLKEIEDEERMLPLGRGLALAKGICGGLAAAHGIGVLHRDLKPENVIVTEDGVPHLMDFGIAVEQALYRGEKEETVPGTPQFLAPELLRGADPSVVSDVYAMGVLLYEMFTGRVPFDDNDTARLVRRVLAEAPPKAETLRPDLPPELLSILDRAVAKDPAARFSDAPALADAIARFEGQVLDRVLAEVSVTRAKMVKLMVILEANKSLAATFDSTETLRIILKTATSETDAERGTIFLREPGTDELVSQILEGGSIQPIRLKVGRGIAGAVAENGSVINTTDAYSDPRFHAKVDASSGFRTQSILAAPLRTPAGEIVGVVEILNKRHGAFTKEDEEFLKEVGTHAALAVEGVRQHEAAVERARREGAAAVIRSAAALLAPGAWPETPGFESAPLRWRSEQWNILSYAVEAGAGRIAFLLVEDPRAPEEAFGALIRAIGAGRPALASESPAQVVRRVIEAEPGCQTAAAAWSGELLAVAAAGTELPILLREGRPVPCPVTSDRGVFSAEAGTSAGDLLVLASRGLSQIRFAAKPIPPGELLVWLAREALERPIPAAFARIVAEGKKTEASPGPRDVMLLAARRLE
ncbi:MAG: protein kinase domain-containing protein [Thermoanaerobaculia bacterium]